MQVDVTYTFHCVVAGCDVTATQHQESCRYAPGGALPLPRLPPRWLDLGPYIFCPRHAVVLSVDEEVHPLATPEPEPEPTPD
jgi:hypothetical protein